jgi:1,4-alpha-glucan branching enzyme
MTGPDLLGDEDLWLFNEGAHTTLYERLGAQLLATGGAHVGLWAPNAAEVSVVGDFNRWKPGVDPLEPRGRSGIWQGEVPGLSAGERYKYHLRSRVRGYSVDKADPFAFRAEEPPRTASVAWDLRYDWGDAAWMARRGAANALDAPMNIYEVHLGSWRHAEGARQSLGYRDIAEPLARYVTETGYTHVELMPVMEHPFYGSWGYQTTGYFAPTSRFGTPQEFMALVDTLHQHGVGVILDWVPSHFPEDEHGLGFFDGTHLYEHADPRKGFHPDWRSLIFNYDRYEVRSFLLSSAHFWLDHYHADGLRVDAVASMLYLDYSRGPGQWVPNEHGGNENLGALRFLKKLNETVYARFPDVQTFAEESTAWPMVSRPTDMGGLGFGLKWDMGWMHDTLEYFEHDPIHRRYAQGELSFRMVYAFTENFTLPLSHDEVVHGKGSLLAKMPGDRWQQLANLRALLGYQYAQPGKKLLFMGDDMGMEMEWDHDDQLPWWILQRPEHEGIRRWVETLNRLVRAEPALHELDFEPAGFEWVDASDSAASVLSFLRRPRRDEGGHPSTAGGRDVLVVANLTPVPRSDYSVGVPVGGRWAELANSDGRELGGSGLGNLGGVEAVAAGAHGRPWSLPLTLPPLSVVFLAPDGPESVPSPRRGPAIAS